MIKSQRDSDTGEMAMTLTECLTGLQTRIHSRAVRHSLGEKTALISKVQDFVSGIFIANVTVHGLYGTKQLLSFFLFFQNPSTAFADQQTALGK